MLKKALCITVIAASAAITGGCAHHTVLTAENAQAAYRVGLKLAAQDRANDAKHRSEMDRLVEAAVIRTRDSDRAFLLLLRLHNKSSKAIKSLGAGLEVDDRRGTRLGLAEIDAPIHIPPHGTVTLWQAVRYVRFGEDTGNMVVSAGQPKRTRLEITELKYADGSDAGYDD